MSEKWKCHNCGAINPANATKCLICNTTQKNPDEIAKERANKDKEIRNTIEEIQNTALDKEFAYTKWEYCAIYAEKFVTGSRGFLPFSYTVSDEEKAFFCVYGKEGIEFPYDQISKIIPMLGDNGWELVSATESAMSFGSASTNVMLGQSWFFKRQKNNKYS